MSHMSSQLGDASPTSDFPDPSINSSEWQAAQGPEWIICLKRYQFLENTLEVCHRQHLETSPGLSCFQGNTFVAYGMKNVQVNSSVNEAFFVYLRASTQRGVGSELLKAS